MSKPRLVRSRDLVRIPWKNGGGTTVEVAVAPPGAAVDRFDWRISMAEVTRDGPFSTFPGIDRTLVLARGRDLRLEVDGETHRLAAVGDRLAFAGEATTIARLGGVAIRDINVMSRRGCFSHRVLRLTAGTVPDLAPRPEVVVLAALRDTTARLDGVAFDLGDLDMLVVDGGFGNFEVNGDAILVELRRVAG